MRFATVIVRGIFLIGFLLASLVLCKAEPRPPRFAAIQFRPEAGNVASNQQRLARLISQAAKSGIRGVVLPELALSGPLTSLSEQQRSNLLETVPGPTTDFFAQLAGHLHIWIAVSIAERAESNAGQYYISVVLLDETGRIASKYRKINPRQTGDDGPGLVRGSPRGVLDSDENHGQRIGAIAGDDVRVAVPRLAVRGAYTIFVAANFSSHEPVNWYQVCSALSRKYRVNLIVANLKRGADRSLQSRIGGIYLGNGTFVPAAAGQAIVSAAPAIPRTPYASSPPLGLPSVPVPTYYASSPGLIHLGQELFFDTNLSSNKKVSCGSCHEPNKFFADGRQVGVGVDGRLSQRNVPTLLNVAYRGILFWDGASSSLEDQSKYPMGHFAEMNLDYYSVLAYVRSRPSYVGQFRQVNGPRPVKFEDIALALAAYERTLLSGESPFDRFYYGKDASALSSSAARGLQLFQGKAHCSNCHTIGEHYSLFMDNEFHNTGIGFSQGTYADLGLGNLAFEKESGKFLTPTLRHIAETGPYMHDGSMGSLEAVVDFYDRGGNPNPHLDPRIKPLGLTPAEKDDLVQFLRSLTGSLPTSEVNHVSTVRGQQTVSP